MRREGEEEEAIMDQSHVARRIRGLIAREQISIVLDLPNLGS